MDPRRFAALIILDGWGINPREDYNAIAQARGLLQSLFGTQSEVIRRHAQSNE